MLLCHDAFYAMLALPLLPCQPPIALFLRRCRAPLMPYTLLLPPLAMPYACLPLLPLSLAISMRDTFFSRYAALCALDSAQRVDVYDYCSRFGFHAVTPCFFFAPCHDAAAMIMLAITAPCCFHAIIICHAFSYFPCHYAIHAIAFSLPPIDPSSSRRRSSFHLHLPILPPPVRNIFCRIRRRHAWLCRPRHRRFHIVTITVVRFIARHHHDAVTTRAPYIFAPRRALPPARYAMARACAARALRDATMPRHVFLRAC